jgi:DNA-binding MarR family transcriptional regulator
MVKKQEIKQSEARILFYLSVVDKTRKHVTAISNKLEIDYSYCMRVLQAMVAKKWLFKHQYRRHMFYDLTADAPLELAKNAFNSGVLQGELQGYLTAEVIEKPEKQALNEVEMNGEEREEVL